MKIHCAIASLALLIGSHAWAIDPSMPAEMAIAEAQSMDCQANALDCRYYAVVENVARFQACIAEGERRNGEPFAHELKRQMEYALRNWSALNAPGVRAAAFARYNPLRDDIYGSTLQELSSLDDQGFQDGCARSAHIRANLAAEAITDLAPSARAIYEANARRQFERRAGAAPRQGHQPSSTDQPISIFQPRQVR